MIDICKENIKRKEIKYINADLFDINVENSSIIILNLTLQFIDIKKRTDLLKQLYSQLNKSGMIIIQEKITLDRNSDDIFVT